MHILCTDPFGNSVEISLRRFYFWKIKKIQVNENLILKRAETSTALNTGICSLNERWEPGALGKHHLVFCKAEYSSPSSPSSFLGGKSHKFTVNFAEEISLGCEHEEGRCSVPERQSLRKGALRRSAAALPPALATVNH